MAFHTNMAYEASAGSGKTFALVIRYISLLYLGAKPNTILALTFTNKAANEMAERINKVLRELDQPSRAVERSEISRNTGLSEEVLLVQKERIYHTFLQSDLKISTIDKFFSQILRKFSLNLALMPDFQIEENSDEVKLIEQFLQQTKKHDRYIDLIKFAAIESKKLGNIFSLLENLYAKDGELQNITIPHVDYYHEKEIIKQVKTLEALFLECEQLSQSGKNAFKFDNIDDLLKKTWLQKQSCAEYTYFKKCFTPQADILLSKIKSTITDYLQNKDAYLKSRYLELYQIYKETKRAYNTNTNKLSFNDVSNNVFDLLRNNIHSDFLYFRLDAKIDHILIDEFQDTNVIQYKILEPILDEISAGIGTKAFKTLFYVGDIKQSIYRFRGGAKELFHHTASAYGIHLEALTTNYRSDAKIVSFVNESFRSLIPGYKDQQFKGDPTLGYVQVSVTESLINEIVISVQMLTQQGVQADNIAILTYANSDAFIIEEALLQKDPTLKITTQTTAKLINASMVSAIIELLKYLYFQDPLYKVNFLTKIGLSWDYDLKLEGFSKHQDLTKLVKRIIENFKLYSHDDSLLKFLEVISHYKDIESFLFESEELTIDSPSKQERGIKILTIHKSKGLEFDHVIIADRFKRKSIDRSSFIFSYNNIELRNLDIRITNRNHFDPAYKEALEAEKKLSEEDALNLLYVAFTRAKSSLIICQKEKESSFGVLGLNPRIEGNITSDVVEEKLEESRPLKYEKITLGLQEQKLKNEKELPQNFEAIQFGLALHYMLEILESFSIKTLNNAYWGMKNRYEMILGEDKCEQIKQRVTNLLHYKPFLALVKGTIYKEQSIIYNKELKQLDLLIEQTNRWIIVDYKSSEQRQSEHVAQVLHYKKAIKKIVSKPVKAYLCYIREASIELIEI